MRSATRTTARPPGAGEVSVARDDLRRPCCLLALGLRLPTKPRAPCCCPWDCPGKQSGSTASRPQEKSGQEK